MFDPNDLAARDPGLIRALLPAVRVLNRRYFRLEVSGLENVPRERAMLIANHNGGILGPDLFCTLGSLWDCLGADAPLYALAHDFVMRQVTGIGRAVQRLGAVRACPENAHRILEKGGLALVYPGGDLEAYRHSSKRDAIVLGERTGFVRVAQATEAQMVPVVAHGAHRSAWIFTEGKLLADLLALRERARVSRFPIALALPWGLAPGPWLPYFPLPFRIQIKILPPVTVAAGADPVEVRRMIAAQMQQALDSMAAASGTRR